MVLICFTITIHNQVYPATVLSLLQNFNALQEIAATPGHLLHGNDAQNAIDAVQAKQNEFCGESFHDEVNPHDGWDENQVHFPRLRNEPSAMESPGRWLLNVMLYCRCIMISTQFDIADAWNLHAPAKPSSTAQQLGKFWSQASRECTVSRVYALYFTAIVRILTRLSPHEPTKTPPILQRRMEMKLASHIFPLFHLGVPFSLIVPSPPSCHCRLWGHIESALDLNFRTTTRDESNTLTISNNQFSQTMGKNEWIDEFENKQSKTQKLISNFPQI